MLAVPEDIALAAQRQVEGGQLEAVVGALHGRQTCERLLALGSGDEEHLGRLLAAAHTSAQLVQLGESEAVGVLDDHDRGVGNIHAHLDDRRGHEHLDLAFAELLHDLALGLGAHAAVKQPHRPVGEGGALQHLGLASSRRHVVAGQVGIVLDGHGRVVLLPRRIGLARASRRLGIAGLGILAHERADDEHLLAARERLAGRLEGVSLLLAGEHPRRAPRAVVGAVLDVGQGEIAVERERQGARDGGRRQVQRVGRLALFQKLRPLIDAEALLLVDDRQGEVVRHDVVGEQRVSADEHVHLPGGEAFRNSGSLARGRGAREQGDAHPGAFQTLAQALHVLAGEHFRGREEHGLSLGIGGSGQGVARHDGLAGAHVSQKHMVGHRRRGQGGKNLVARPLLLAGELEGKRGGESGKPRAVHHVGVGHAPGAAGGALLHEEQLQIQQLLVDEPPPRLVGLGHRAREMDGAQRGVPAHEPVAQAQPQRQRIEEPLGGFQSVGHDAAHPGRRELLGGRVHRHHRAGDLLPFPDHLDEGVGHALVAVVEGHLARNGHRIPRLHLIHQPRLAKAGDYKDARAVHQRDLHELEIVAGLLQLDLVHRAANGADLPDARSAAGLHLGEVDIGSGEVRQQIAQRAHAEFLERGCPRRADQTNPRHGLVQRERSFFPINGQTIFLLLWQSQTRDGRRVHQASSADGIEGGLCWGDDALNAFDTSEDCLSD